MRIDIITVFPAYLDPLQLSLIGKARDSGILDIRIVDLRDFATDPHRSVDDAPYGGGPGMVMSAEPWGRALDAVQSSDPSMQPHLIVPTPSGTPFTQRMADQLASAPWLVFACARYEGIDARVAEHYRTDSKWSGVSEVSIGDYVLAGGDVAALVMIETIGRLMPGVLGNPESAVQDSFSPGTMTDLVEGPMYTRPPIWRGLPVPEVLLGGHHGEIAAWRRRQAEERTQRMRPDLTSAGPHAMWHTAPALNSPESDNHEDS